MKEKKNSVAALLLKEKIISLSELQKNPSRALDAAIVRVVKNGKEIGIFMKKEEFEDFVEDHLSLKPEFEKKLKKAISSSKKKKTAKLQDIL